MLAIASNATQSPTARAAALSFAIRIVLLIDIGMVIPCDRICPAIFLAAILVVKEKRFKINSL
ncbi:MAG: hypothetical protein ACREB8_09150 [Pseudolabrys sp.]